jgi:hypothetical protein
MLAVVVVAAGCAPRPTGRWRDLGLPSEGLVEVYPSTDEHGFFGDYTGTTGDHLLEVTTSALEEAGYVRRCEAFEGRVRGFRRGEEELGVKVDLLGERVGLSVFDGASSEALILGVCFGRLRVGPEDPVR